MANERQFKIKSFFVATRGVDEYRQTIADVVRPDDVVLEIGCEWGVTTKLLAERCPNVLGTDVSLDCIARARTRNPQLRFDVLDAFDVRRAAALAPKATVVYIDVSGLSGYRGLLDVIALLNMYATVLEPRTIVVKSGALKHFAQHCRAWPGAHQGPPSSKEARRTGPECGA
jgi:trans-aconitate methyltransferase